MTPHLRRSRVSKALTDAGLAASFEEAEARLDSVEVCVELGAEAARTPAGQAAALTALVTAVRCFGRATFVCPETALPVLATLRAGGELCTAARGLGARLATTIPPGTTHLIQIGGPGRFGGWTVHPWWDRWRAGTRTKSVPSGDGRVAVAGVFAGALAVRQVFATVRRAGEAPQDATVSLWEPWIPDPEDPGPARFTAPNAIWFAGLGHLGQAFVWNLLWLPYRGPRRAVLQDDQRIGIENEPTSLLVDADDVGAARKKVRVAASWLEPAGWSTELIERRHRGDIALVPEDPPYLLAGLDALPPRRLLGRAGFDVMVDAGIGHGAHDFEGLQVRTIPKGADLDRLWSRPEPERSREALLASPAYDTLQGKGLACGAYQLAQASVAVPFVGAATAAIAIGQLVRSATMLPGGALIQMGLAAPSMIIDGGLSAGPRNFLGGETMDLHAGA